MVSRKKLFRISGLIGLTITIVLTACAAPLEAQDTGREELYLETEQIPINNCGGPAEVAVQRAVSKTFYHDVEVESDAGINLNVLVVSTVLGQRYGYQDGEADTRTYAVNLIAPRHSKVVYVLQWREVWVKGIVYDPNAGKTRGTYRLRKDIQMQIVDTYTEECL